jgi:hypothetical protein
MPEKPSAQTKIDRSGSRKQGIPEKSKDTLELPRGSKTLCIPFEPASYPQVVRDRKGFRGIVDEVYAQHPELFPAAMGEGYTLHDTQVSAKLGIGVRRIKLKATNEVYGLCPAFVMPYRCYEGSLRLTSDFLTNQRGNQRCRPKCPKRQTITPWPPRCTWRWN